MRPEGSASTAAEFSAQALALLGSSDLELKKLPFATRLQQAVFQRTVSPDVIVVPDRIESGELRPSPVYVPVPAPKSIPAVEGYSTPLGTTIWNASEDTRVPEMEHRLEFVGKDDTRYVGAHPAAARWTSPRVRDMELWGHSQAQKARHAELNGGIHAEHEHPEESANSSINLDGRWTTKRDRDRRIWGTDQPRRIQDAHLHGRMEGVHPSDENNGYHDASSGDSKWASKRDRDRAIWGHPQVHEVQDMSIDDRMQEDLSYFQEEFLDARGVEVYLSDRGIRLQKQRNTASVEIDPNDFKGSFHLFADGRRGSDGTGGSGHSIVFLRGATNPAPLESSHPDVAKAAATVHQESINTMFTDMTATGATDTGSYSANLCPAIPITDWMKHNPGKAKLTIDINLLLKGCSPLNADDPFLPILTSVKRVQQIVLLT